MTPEAIRAVRTSWALVAREGTPLADAFYARLFTIAPATRALFPDDMSALKGKFTEMMTEIVMHLDRPAVLVGTTAALGRRHVDYAVRPEHYPLVGDALRAALDDVLGAQMTPEARDAWREAYQLLAGLMQRGAARP